MMSGARAEKTALSSRQSPVLRAKQRPRWLRQLLHRPEFRFADPRQEALFREHVRPDARDGLMFGLQMGIAGFLVYWVVDAALNERTPADWLYHGLVIPVLAVLILDVRMQASCNDARLNYLIRAACVAATFELALLARLDTQPGSFHETWIGLLPLYFFSYGQIWLPVSETVLFGLLSTLAVLFNIQAAGAATATLIAPLLTLLLVNGFGLCLRFHRENHSRQLFQEHLTVERNTRDKTEFLQHLSHNVRQPLQAMSCYSAVLDTALLNHGDERLTFLAGRLGLAIDELNQTFNHILDIVNLENGQQRLQIAPVDINQLLSLLENRFAALASARGLRLSVVLRTRPPYAVAGDISVLNQILSNLIDNAIKYTPSGWIVVGAVKISPTRMKFSVRDSGIGITETQREQVFKPFVRCHRRQDDPCQPGMGLGLAYVASALACLPEHKLDLHSQPGRGTHFQLYLPIAYTCVDNPAETADFTDALHGLLVFIVDDDRDVLDALSQQLQCAGCLVQTASCVADIQPALEELLRTPDCLITDFYLGDNETAHDVIAAMEAECGALPTLILSAHAIPPADKAKWPKHTHLLRKPASARAVLEAIGRTMAA